MLSRLQWKCFLVNLQKRIFWALFHLIFHDNPGHKVKLWQHFWARSEPSLQSSTKLHVLTKLYLHWGKIAQILSSFAWQIIFVRLGAPPIIFRTMSFCVFQSSRFWMSKSSSLGNSSTLSSLENRFTKKDERVPSSKYFNSFPRSHSNRYRMNVAGQAMTSSSNEIDKYVKFKFSQECFTTPAVVISCLILSTAGATAIGLINAPIMSYNLEFKWVEWNCGGHSTDHMIKFYKLSTWKGRWGYCHSAFPAISHVNPCLTIPCFANLTARQQRLKGETVENIFSDELILESKLNWALLYIWLNHELISVTITQLAVTVHPLIPQIVQLTNTRIKVMNRLRGKLTFQNIKPGQFPRSTRIFRDIRDTCILNYTHIEFKPKPGVRGFIKGCG